MSLNQSRKIAAKKIFEESVQIGYRWLIKLTATGFGLGWIRTAPGTFGTFPGILLALCLGAIPHPWRSLLFVFLVLLGFSVIQSYEKWYKIHDAKQIVLDEILGFALIFLFVPISFKSLLLGFVLFRVFDISKIGPVGWCERRWHGKAFSTLMDDLMAGLLSAIVIIILFYVEALI